jgi:hypothetical protein
MPGSSKWFPSLRFPQQNPVYASYLSHTWQVGSLLPCGVPVTTWGPCHHVLRVLKFWMKERPPIWRVAVNILKKQSRTADTGCSSSLGIGRGANNSSAKKRVILRNVHRDRLGPGLILWYGPNSGNFVISASEKCCQIYRWISTARWVLLNTCC